MSLSSITISTSINSSIDKVWDFFNSPEHIANWNTASTDWHTTKAENNFTEGGKFSYRMEAKDGSFGFDFSGKYTHVAPHKTIEYTLDDERKVKIHFEEENNHVLITETFEAEGTNPIEMQQAGWQAILNNFKTYVENH